MHQSSNIRQRNVSLIWMAIRVSWHIKAERMIASYPIASRMAGSIPISAIIVMSISALCSLVVDIGQVTPVRRAFFGDDVISWTGPGSELLSANPTPIGHPAFDRIAYSRDTITTVDMKLIAELLGANQYIATYGWPLRSCYWRRHGYGFSDAIRMPHFFGAIDLELPVNIMLTDFRYGRTEHRYMLSDARYLPTGILWGGFVINMLCFMPIGYFAASRMIAVWLRYSCLLQKHLLKICWKCKYPLPATLCPECGTEAHRLQRSCLTRNTDV